MREKKYILPPKIGKWLKATGRSKAWLSRTIGLQDKYFYHLKRTVPISIGVCKKIIQITEGEITMRDLRPDLFE